MSEKLPVLRRLTSSKLSDEQIQVILPIMDYFRQMCVIDEESGEPHRMNQNILYNQDVIGDIFDILNQKVEAAFVVSGMIPHLLVMHEFHLNSASERRCWIEETSSDIWQFWKPVI